MTEREGPHYHKLNLGGVSGVVVHHCQAITAPISQFCLLINTPYLFTEKLKFRPRK